MPHRFDDDTEFERALAAPTFLVFKHSPICPVSTRAFAEYRAFVAEHEDTPTAWVDVIEQRPLARRIAAETGVRHESPQAILLRAGRVEWNASHGAITRASLASAVGAPA